MAFSGNGSSSVYVANPIIAAFPFSVSCWYYSNRGTNPSVEALLGFSSTNTSSNNSFWLAHASTTFHAYTQWDSYYQSAQRPSVPLKTWVNVGAAWTAVNYREAWMQGTSGYATLSITNRIAVIEQFSVGCFYDDYGNAPYGSLNGWVAELGIWSCYLSASDRAALNAGWTPPMVRPDALLAYYPLLTDFRDHWKNGYHLNLSRGSPALVAHPPGLIYPRRKVS